MATLKRRKPGVLEEEFCVRGGDFAMAVDYRIGRKSHGQALEYLLERRWSREDAELFLQMAGTARI